MPALMEKITQPVYSEWGAVWSFDQIYKHEYDKTLTYVPVKWSGKLSLSMLDGKKLVQKGTSLVAVDTNDPLPEVSLVALDADWSVQSSKSPTYVAEPKMDKVNQSSLKIQNCPLIYFFSSITNGLCGSVPGNSTHETQRVAHGHKFSVSGLTNGVTSEHKAIQIAKSVAGP